MEFENAMNKIVNDMQGSMICMCSNSYQRHSMVSITPPTFNETESIYSAATLRKTVNNINTNEPQGYKLLKKITYNCLLFCRQN